MVNIESLEQQAVEAAIQAKWQEAITLNIKITKVDRQNIGAYLRLGFAYLQTGSITDAKKAYKHALRLQPKNNIALEQLEKVDILDSKGKGKSKHKGNSANLDPNLFLEMPGKTKVVSLVNLGQKEDLAGLMVGQEIKLKEKKRRLEVRSHDGSYIGCLPDDVSKRLIFFLKDKSVYKTYIKETSLTEVDVFIKEISKGNKVSQFPSFPANPYTYLADIQKEDGQNTEHEEEEEAEDWDKFDHEAHLEDKADVESVISVEDEDEELEE